MPFNLQKVGLGLSAYITNVPVFRAGSAIEQGSVMVSGATTTAQGATNTVAADTTDANNFIGVSIVSSSQASAAPENVNGIGWARFNIATSGVCARGTTNNGQDWLPLCINVDAFYLGAYSTTTGAGTASNNWNGFSASTTTNIITGTTGLDVLGGWLFSVATVSGGTATFSGSLRYIANQAATTSLTLRTAMSKSADSEMIWWDRLWKQSGVFRVGTTDFLRSVSGTSGSGLKLNGVSMVITENYVQHDAAPLHALRTWVDDGLNGLTGVRAYSEVRFTDPYLIQTEKTA